MFYVVCVRLIYMMCGELEAVLFSMHARYLVTNVCVLRVFVDRDH